MSKTKIEIGDVVRIHDNNPTNKAVKTWTKDHGDYVGLEALVYSINEKTQIASVIILSKYAAFREIDYPLCVLEIAFHINALNGVIRFKDKLNIDKLFESLTGAKVKYVKQVSLRDENYFLIYFEDKRVLKFKDNETESELYTDESEFEIDKTEDEKIETKSIHNIREEEELYPLSSDHSVHLVKTSTNESGRVEITEEDDEAYNSFREALRMAPIIKEKSIITDQITEKIIRASHPLTMKEAYKKLSKKG